MPVPQNPPWAVACNPSGGGFRPLRCADEDRDYPERGLRAYIEVWTSSAPQAVPLDTDRITVGSEDGNDVTLGADPTASRLHAAFERFGSGWCVIDLGSSNGTHVNGERILGPRALHHGDEILIGGTRLVFRAEAGRSARPTLMGERPPELTHREHDVLLALCRPVLSGDLLTEAASVKQIAAELVLTEDAVKKHLRRLYEKFQIDERPARARLANEAIRRGAVSLGDLRARTDPS
jgi:hypothetical protein